MTGRQNHRPGGNDVDGVVERKHSIPRGGIHRTGVVVGFAALTPPCLCQSLRMPEPQCSTGITSTGSAPDQPRREAQCSASEGWQCRIST